MVRRNGNSTGIMGMIPTIKASKMALFGIGFPMLASGFTMGLSHRLHAPALIPPAVSKCFSGFASKIGGKLSLRGALSKRSVLHSASATATSADADEQIQGYKMPHPDIKNLVEAEQTPQMLISPPASGSEWIAVLEKAPMLTLADLAQPEMKLAGVRFLPELDVPSRKIRSHSMLLKRRTTGEEIEVTGIPKGGMISGVNWSADGKVLAFCVLTEPEGLRLYTLDPLNPVAKLASDLKLSAVLASPYDWGATSDQIILNTVPSARPSSPPERPRVPKSPAVQECVTGVASPVRTYQDLLQDEHDEMLFDFFTTTTLFELSLSGSNDGIKQVGGGSVRQIGPPGMHSDYGASPDGKFLLVERIRTPFSRTTLYNRFPSDIEIRPLDNSAMAKAGIVHRLPLAEVVPIGRDSCREGPRGHRWRSDAPATLQWVEALDEGDSKKEVEHRDAVYTLDVHDEGAGGDGKLLLKTKWRCRGLWWGDGDVALVLESEHKTRLSRWWQISPDHPEASPSKPFLEYVTDDRYKHPGSPMTVRLPNNQRVLQKAAGGKALFFSGVGGSDEGDRPFLDLISPLEKNGDGEWGSAPSKRLWRCGEGCYESPIVVITSEGKEVLMTSRETKVDVPNVWEYPINGGAAGSARQVTFIEHPQPALLGVQKRLIKYKRKNDGLELSGMLYTPKGYSPKGEGGTDGPLPALLWAYPTEFKTEQSAGQVQGSPHRFVRVSPTSPLLWVSRGYAVLDDPSMPIVAKDGGEENDFFVPQLVDSAESAVDELQRLGVTDDRVAVGGHSYGAFMTANLLAHSRRFKAGIGRSGAYNRLLTPFGFQSEERTLWEAPDTYVTMSPFMHADKVEAPLLLLHGESDNNPGTFPIQSERLFQALKGLGKTAKLVVLPLESHGYAAKENVLHMCYEMDSWLEKHMSK